MLGMFEATREISGAHVGSASGSFERNSRRNPTAKKMKTVGVSCFETS